MAACLSVRSTGTGARAAVGLETLFASTTLGLRPAWYNPKGPPSRPTSALALLCRLLWRWGTRSLSFLAGTGGGETLPARELAELPSRGG